MKQNEDNKLDQYFKAAFEDMEVEPSNKVWMNIEKELDTKTVVVRKINYLRYSIAASVLIGLFFSVYYFNTATKHNQVANVSAKKDSTIIDSAAKLDEMKKIESSMQPKEANERLADVVEIKTSKKSTIKQIKTTTNKVVQQNKKPLERSQGEAEAIELLKKYEDTRDRSKAAELENRKITLDRPTTLASIEGAKGDKKQITDVFDVVNFLAEKVTGNEETVLVAVNDKPSSTGNKRKSYQLDLGIVKLSRVKNTSN